MKKLFLLILALSLTMSLVACGGDTTNPVSSNGAINSNEPAKSVTLVDVATEQGISLKLPSDMTKLESNFYADKTTGDSASFTVDMADESYPFSEMSQQEFIDFQLSDRDKLVISSYSNDLMLNGNKALICKFSFTSAEGNGITGAIVFITYKGAEYSAALLYSSDNKDSALAKNLDACINSITIIAA